jgi:hypothetical protein
MFRQEKEETVEQGKIKGKNDETKQGLVKEYEKDLDEIFKASDRPLTFDEIEKLVDEKMDTARNEVIQKIIEKKQEKETRKNGEPEETSICICGTEVTLCRDKKGNVKIFERKLHTKRGHIKQKESGYYCPKCRRFFFPSEKRAKVIQGKLQP